MNLWRITLISWSNWRSLHSKPFSSAVCSMLDYQPKRESNCTGGIAIRTIYFSSECLFCRAYSLTQMSILYFTPCWLSRVMSRKSTRLQVNSSFIQQSTVSKPMCAIIDNDAMPSGDWPYFVENIALVVVVPNFRWGVRRLTLCICKSRFWTDSFINLGVT